ncbi:MAG: hypothetical protein MJ196_04620 [Treponemataceae bacterium]|nr:hypothetical protein [Treponemataceae bacterium]
MLAKSTIRNPFPMIGKVFKYEFKSGTRIILPLYGAMIVLALICGISFSDALYELSNTTFKATVGSIFGCTFFAAFLITLVVIEKRFKKGMLEEEAYLNFSLPVTMTEHIIGRLLTFSVWFLMYIAASFVSCIMFMLCNIEWKDFASELSDFLRRFYEEFGIKFASFFPLIVLYGLSLALLVVMYIMAVNAISHLAKKNRTLVASAAAIILMIAYINIFKATINSTIFAHGGNFGVFVTDTVTVHADNVKLLFKLTWKMISLNFAAIVINVIATQAILKYRLNLE